MGCRVLFADDHDVVRAGIRTILRQLPTVEIIGETNNGRDAVRIARELLPDVVILDINMPGLNGVDAAKQILSDASGIKVIALSMHADGEFVDALLRAGASAYILKNHAAEELPQALKAASNGTVYLSPQITHLFVQAYVRRMPERLTTAESALSDREREVLQLLAEGKSSKEIAASLHVAVKTVEANRGQIMKKLQLRSIAKLTKFAIRTGMTGLE